VIVIEYKEPLGFADENQARKQATQATADQIGLAIPWVIYSCNGVAGLRKKRNKFPAARFFHDKLTAAGDSPIFGR
jgi:hypothetical protein